VDADGSVGGSVGFTRGVCCMVGARPVAEGVGLVHFHFLGGRGDLKERKKSVGSSELVFLSCLPASPCLPFRDWAANERCVCVWLSALPILIVV